MNSVQERPPKAFVWIVSVCAFLIVGGAIWAGGWLIYWFMLLMSG